MRRILLIAALLSFNAHAGLVLVGREEMLSNDTFSKFQWYLKNQGQTATADLTDIETTRTKGVPGADLGWKNDVNYDQLMQRDVVVAVIDSGVDYEHDELKDAILQNSAECENGKMPVRPKEDKDGNGFIGDCMGWDFTVPADRGNRPLDEAGHGTHLAGLMAAAPGNGKGIRGLSGKIKILPLKVMRNDPEDKDKKELVQAGLGDIASRVARAIDYAISRNVDVINMSLGWPLHLNHDDVRAAVQRAYAAGIFVVAAAGNNSNAAMLYPCGLPNVACVAGMGLDGEISDSTNYGGHVDFLAPGDEILSTIPKTLGSYYFSVKGYELKSGSSQAAALVSGAAAILKGIVPSLAPADIYRILAQGADHAKAKSGEKFILHGKINLQKSVELLVGAKGNSYAYPDLKNQGILVLDGNREAKLTVPLKTLGNAASFASVRELTGGADLESGLNGDKLEVTLKNTDLAKDHQIRLELTVDGNSFRHDMYLLRDPLLAKGVRRLPLKMELGSVFEPVRDEASLLASPEYYSLVSDKEGIRFILGREMRGELLTAGSVYFAGAKKVLYVRSLDMNSDGSPDYLIFAQHVEADKRPSLRIHFLNAAMEPLFGAKHSSWLYLPEAAVMEAGRLQFVSWNHPLFGKIQIPVQLNSGYLPSRDQDRDPWTPEDSSTRKRFYYFMPEITEKGVEVRTRVFDSPKFLDNFRSRLQLPKSGDFVSYQVMGGERAKLYVGFGTGDILHYLEVNATLDSAGDSQYVSHADFAAPPAFSLYQPVRTFNSAYERNGALGFFRIISENLASWFYRDGDNTQYGDLSIPMSKDRLQGQVLISPYGDSLSVFFATSDYLVEQRTNRGGVSTQFKRPLTRVSFLPGQLFNETLYPIRGNTGDLKPLLYVDASVVSYRAIYLIEPRAKGLVAPIGNSFFVPENCEPLNPSEQGREKKVFTSLLCADGPDSLSILHVPLMD